MKPITFENLRRLMGGGRKKKDRGESSFKRSDSFKRISIKRNYLDRGGRSRVPHPPKGKALSRSRSPSPCSTPPPVAQPRAPSPDPMVIGYGQWIRCQRQSNSSSDERPPTPPPRRRGSSIATDASLEIIRLDRSPVMVRRRPNTSAGTASVMSPGGGAGGGDKEAEASRPDSAISVNLGRVWLDAPMAMAPRSLELPRPPPQSAPQDPRGAPPPGGRRAHHSLDSALKESRRFLTPRALSSHARDSRITSSKDSGFSFSISIPRLADVSPTSLSPPPGPLPGPPPHGSESSGGGGFFRRKKKLSKPSPSVSRDGYFKRTSCASLTSTGSQSGSAAAEGAPEVVGVRRGSSRRKKGARGPGPGATVASRGSVRGSLRGSLRGSTRGSGRRKKLPQLPQLAQLTQIAPAVVSCGTGTVRSDIYQVVVGRAPRALHALKLDPMFFVAPEKRKPSNASESRRAPHRYEVQEIRGPFVPRDPAADPALTAALVRDDTEEDEGLYECISPQSTGSLRASSVESLDRLDSEPERPSAGKSAEKEVEQVVTPRRPSVTIKTKRNHVTKVMINMPSDRSSSDADGSDSDDLDDDDDEEDLHDEGYAPPGFSPVPRCRNVHPGSRRPVQRRKSARRNVKYLAKPNIHRAPSTLRRARKCEYAALQRRLVAGLDTPGPARAPLSTHVRTPRTPDSESDGEWI